jgi:hypothetical protein
MLADERLQEMIKGLKPFAESKYGIKINEFSSKDIYSALQELKNRRENDLRPANKFLGASINQQLIHVESELKEVVDAIYNRNDVTRSVAEILDEINDLQISAETLKAIIEPNEDVRRKAMIKTIRKNASRGYCEVST